MPRDESGQDGGFVFADLSLTTWLPRPCQADLAKRGYYGSIKKGRQAISRAVRDNGPGACERDAADFGVPLMAIVVVVRCLLGEPFTVANDAPYWGANLVLGRTILAVGADEFASGNIVSQWALSGFLSLRYPERFARPALGQTSKAVHRAYARKVQATLRSLWELRTKGAKIASAFSERNRGPADRAGPARAGRPTSWHQARRRTLRSFRRRLSIRRRIRRNR